MVAFVAYAHGFKPKQPANEAPEAMTPGGALVLMFPDGKVRIG